jgi:hypothetical protein
MVLPCFLLGRPVSQSDKGLALMDRSRRLASSWRLGEWEQQAWDLDALSRSSGRPLTAALPAQARLAWERPGRFSRSAVLPQNQARSYINEPRSFSVRYSFFRSHVLCVWRAGLATVHL